MTDKELLELAAKWICADDEEKPREPNSCCHKTVTRRCDGCPYGAELSPPTPRNLTPMERQVFRNALKRSLILRRTK
jgi:hypothetical protein